MFDEIFKYANEMVKKKREVNKLAGKLPESGEKQYTWTAESLVNVLYNFEDNLNKLKLSVKYTDIFLELAYLVNEGYITIHVENHDYFEKDFSERREEICEQMEKIPEDLSIELYGTFNYSEEIVMVNSLLNRFKKEFNGKYNFSNKNYSIHFEEDDVICRIGNAPVKYFINAFKKGIKKFIIAPFALKNKNANIYIFAPTERYINLLEEEQKKKKELKKTFSKIKGKYVPEIPVYKQEPLMVGDLVEFNSGDKAVRGFIEYIVSEESDFEEYLEEKLMEFNTNISDKYLFNPKDKPQINFMFDNDEFYDSNIIVKVIEKKGQKITIEFHAVNKSEITAFLIQDWSLSSVYPLLELGRERDPKLKIKINQEDDEENSNAYYAPDEHSITINVNKIYESFYTNFALYGYHPNDFLRVVVAHELGHSDARGKNVFEGDYKYIIDTSNELSKTIEENIKKIEESDEIKIELIQETMLKSEERVELLKKHYKNVIESEMNAFIFGMDYLSSDNLKRLFQKNNYDTYTSYLESELKPLRRAQERMYQIQRFSELAFSDAL